VREDARSILTREGVKSVLTSIVCIRAGKVLHAFFALGQGK